MCFGLTIIGAEVPSEKHYNNLVAFAYKTQAYIEEVLGRPVHAFSSENTTKEGPYGPGGYWRPFWRNAYDGIDLFLQAHEANPEARATAWSTFAVLRDLVRRWAAEVLYQERRAVANGVAGYAALEDDDITDALWLTRADYAQENDGDITGGEMFLPWIERKQMYMDGTRLPIYEDGKS